MIVELQESELLTKEQVMRILRIKQERTLFYKKKFSMVKKGDEYCFVKSELEKFLNTNFEEPFLNNDEAAAYLEITESQLLHLVNERIIPYYSYSVDQTKMGSEKQYGKGTRRLFKKSDLEKYQLSGNIDLILHYPAASYMYKWLREMFSHILHVDKSELMLFLSCRERETLIEILNGNTLEGIGEKFGLTRERVRQILEKARRRIDFRLFNQLEAIMVKQRLLIEKNKELESQVIYLKTKVPLPAIEMSANANVMQTILRRKIADFYDILSIRCINCLKAADVRTMAELVYLPHADYLLQFRNFGRKSQNEIIALVAKYDLKFGMDISAYGLEPSTDFMKWNAEDIERFKFKRNIS